MTSSSTPSPAPSSKTDPFKGPTERRLIDLTSDGSLGGRGSKFETCTYYSKTDHGRRRFQTEVLDLYMSDGASVGKDGLAAILTAGPPGAGKSTSLAGLGEDLTGYRRLDADLIKDHLLEKAVEDGIFDSILAETLADGHFVLPNELASLVHVESANLHNELIRRSLEDRVNVIIEGTFTHSPLIQRYMGWFATVDYRKLKLVDVEVDCATAMAQASKRWWDGRKATIAGSGTGLGGRFTSPRAIAASYPPGVAGGSACNANAVSFFNDDSAEIFEELELRVYDGSGSEPAIYRRINGNIQGDVPEPLSIQSLRNSGAAHGVVDV